MNHGRGGGAEAKLQGFLQAQGLAEAADRPSPFLPPRLAFFYRSTADPAAHSNLFFLNPVCQNILGSGPLLFPSQPLPFVFPRGHFEKVSNQLTQWNHSCSSVCTHECRHAFVHAPTRALACMWKSEETVLSLPCGSQGFTQVPLLGGKCPYLLSCPSGPMWLLECGLFNLS